MGKAVIVVGTHLSGKSRTINEHLKPLLGLGPSEHVFGRNSKDGFILSQSFEEASTDPQTQIGRRAHYDLLVLAARPAEEEGSLLEEMQQVLSFHNFQYEVVMIENNEFATYYAGKALEILSQLDS